jgi:hypothetical protein
MTYGDIVKEVFGTPPQRGDEDPYQSEEYQKFVEIMVEDCHCHEAIKPCDGVLAGGLCDGLKGAPDMFGEERESPNDDE